MALAARAAAGDEAAFSQLFERHKDAVYAVGLRILRQRADASDLVQDTFLVLLEGRRGRLPTTSVRGWLMRVASNLAIDRIRQRRVRSAKPTDLPVEAERPAAGPGPGERAQDSELSIAVQSVVDTLSPRLRSAVLLRYAAGLSYEEVAEALQCSIGTVKSRLSRAHARLAGPLDELRRSHGLSPGGGTP